MSTSTKQSLAMACKAAEDFRDLFRGFEGPYDRWVVAGSVRRQKADCADIDHVVIPTMGEITPAGGGGLFGEKVTGNLLWGRCDELLAEGKIEKYLRKGTPRWGDKLRSVLFRETVHELWTADLDNWGAQLAIRTGPGDYSKMLVTRLQQSGYMNKDSYVWNKNDWHCSFPHCGWAGTKPTRKLKSEFDGEEHVPPIPATKLWISDADGREGGPFVAICPNCQHVDTINPARMSVPDEKAYFKLCGLPYCEPESRR